MRKVSISLSIGGAALVGLLTIGALNARADHARGHSQQWDDSSSKKIDAHPDPGETYQQNPPASRPAPPSRGGGIRPSQRNPVPPDSFPADPPFDAVPDREAIRRGAKQFQDAVQDGRVHLLNSSREGAQLDGLRLDGFYTWPAPPSNPPRYFRADPGGEGDGPIGDDTDPTVLMPHASASRAGSADLRAPVGRGSARQSPRGTSAPQSLPSDTDAVTTSPPTALFLMLNRLATRSTAQRPLEISSLMRPPYRSGQFQHAGITNPHSLGLAADITAFGGHRIRTDNPEECVQALLSLLRALPPGRYRMGLPKAPDAPVNPALPAGGTGDPVPPPADPRGDRTTERSGTALPSRGRRRQDDRNANRGGESTRRDGRIDTGWGAATQADVTWPFFPPPQSGFDLKGKPVTRFANERYADEQFVNDDRVRQALTDARRRGTDVFALFPDGLNHIHVDVKQVP